MLSPLGPPVVTSPRDFRTRLYDRLHFSGGICSNRLAHRSPLFRETPSPAPPGFPTAYNFPRDLAFIAWLTSRPFSEGLRAGTARLPAGPIAYLFPRDFAFIAWLTGHHFSEGLSSPTAQPVGVVQYDMCPNRRTKR